MRREEARTMFTLTLPPSVAVIGDGTVAGHRACWTH